MAIDMICMNNDCEYYWENNCTKNINEEIIEIGRNGKCLTFKDGVSDWYIEMEKSLDKGDD